MTTPWSRPIALVNARVATPDGVAPSLRFTSRIVSVGEPPRTGDLVVDLDGAAVMPGLINAHDHLELNHYGRLKGRERYGNASAWIDDMRPRLRSDEAIRRGQSHPLAWRVFVGGLKNLLAGVTAVAHHNPLYREIGHRFPVRVVRKYGWAHSLSMQRQPVGARGELGGEIRVRYRGTSRRAPFIVHAAEGIDDVAAAEIGSLGALGCLHANTILVHGVAMDLQQWELVTLAGAGLVWCPASNLFLFGTTAPVRRFLDAGPDAWQHLALGTDSRVTGERDLLDELRVAAAAAPIAPRELLRMVTVAPARMLKLPDCGALTPGAHADLIVVPSGGADPAEALLRAARKDVALVVVGGAPRVGRTMFAPLFRARRTPVRPVVVDGDERVADVGLARAIARCPIPEPGVVCAA